MFASAPPALRTHLAQGIMHATEELSMTHAHVITGSFGAGLDALRVAESACGDPLDSARILQTRDANEWSQIQSADVMLLSKVIEPRLAWMIEAYHGALELPAQAPHL